MKQFALPFAGRKEYGTSYWSWVEDGRPVFVTLYPHCIDWDWRWVKPGMEDVMGRR